MIVRKLRLQRGWTQEQLAQLTGLSVRSIQRIERGQPCSLETRNSLAAVFEVQRSNLHAEDTGSSVSLASEEGAAIEHVKGLKDLSSHVFLYVFFVVAVGFAFGFQHPPILWGLLGWGVGVLAHALTMHEVIHIFGADWERKQIEKRLGRQMQTLSVTTSRPLAARTPRHLGNQIAIVIHRALIQTWRVAMKIFAQLCGSTLTTVGIALFAWVAYDATNVMRFLGIQARMDEAAVAVVTLSLAGCLIALGIYSWRRTTAEPA